MRSIETYYFVYAMSTSSLLGRRTAERARKANLRRLGFMDQIVGYNSLKTVAAAVVLSALAATAVLAQAAIQDPGAFAFYYPYRDLLNGGAPTPAAKLASEPPAAMQAYVAREVASALRGRSVFQLTRGDGRHTEGSLPAR
jgi:hypothetical protein